MMPQQRELLFRPGLPRSATKVKLSNGEFTFVDAEAFESPKTIRFADGYVLTIVPSRFSWGVMPTHTGYAYNRIDRPGGRRLTVYLHRLLVECPPHLYVNHADWCTLNNTVSNLEIVTAEVNAKWRKNAAALRRKYANATELMAALSQPAPA